ncbi:MAG: hypothetical protein OXC81_01945, partial [Betaproteobacteria bacterium]|nr:hypothetical protein [Betaproteobacteria bacterium]
MTLRFFTNECLSDFYNAAEKTACREDTTNRSVEYVFDLPLGSTPFIVGGAQQVIEVPEITFRDAVAGMPNMAPTGYVWVLATVRVAQGFDSNVVWWFTVNGLNGAHPDFSAIFDPAFSNNQVLYLTTKRPLNLSHANYTNGILGLVTLNVSGNTKEYQSVITLSLVHNPEVTVQVNDFRNVNRENLVEIVPNIERTFTVPPAVSSAASDTRLTNGEYRAVLAPNNSLLPNWLEFDAAALQFTVAVEAGWTPGDYPIRMLYIDEESDMKLVDYQFTLRILQPLRLEGITRNGATRYTAVFGGGGLFDSGSTANDSITYLYPRSANNVEAANINCATGNVFGSQKQVQSSAGGFVGYTAIRECDIAANHSRLTLVNSFGANVVNSDHSAYEPVITLSLEIDLAGVRQTVVAAINTGAVSAAGVNGDGSAIGGADPIVVTGYGSGPQLLSDGHVIPANTDLLTLTLNWTNAPTNFRVLWNRVGRHDVNSKVSIPILPGSRLATLKMGSLPLTLDYETMGDIEFGIAAVVSGSDVANDFTRYKRVILRVADVDEPHTIEPQVHQFSFTGTVHTFSARAQDPESLFYAHRHGYTYSLRNPGQPAARWLNTLPGWLSIDDAGQVRVASSATSSFFRVEVAATSKTTPPVTALSTVTMVIAKPLRIASIGGDSISTTLFLDFSRNTCFALTLHLNGNNSGSQLTCGLTQSGTLGGVTNYRGVLDGTGTADNDQDYIAFANGSITKATITITHNGGVGGIGLDIPQLAQTVTRVIDIPYADPNPFSFVNAANPQFVSIPAAAGAAATATSRRFAAGLALATVRVRNIIAGNMVEWSTTISAPPAAAGALGVISSSDREAVIG